MVYTFIMCDHAIVTLISIHWVLVTVPRPQPTADEHTPKVAGRGYLLDWWLSGYKTKSPKMNNSGCCAWRVPHSFHVYAFQKRRVLSWIKVFNAIFNDSSVISWSSVLLEGETGVPRENHRPAITHSKKVESLLPIQIV